jgi:hypothetical protein
MRLGIAMPIPEDFDEIGKRLSREIDLESNGAGDWGFRSHRPLRVQSLWAF